METSPSPPSGNAGGRAHCPSAGSKHSRRPSSPGGVQCGPSRSRACAGTPKPVSRMPSGPSTRSASTSGSGPAGGPRHQDAEHARAHVVEPALARLVRQRDRRHQAQPLVGRRRGLRLRRSGRQSGRRQRRERRRGPGRGEVDAQPEPERQDVAHRDRPGRRHGARGRVRRVGEHDPVGQLRQQPVDRLLEGEDAVVDQREGGRGHHRLGHRGDPEDRVRRHRRRPRPGCGCPRRPARPRRPAPTHQAAPGTWSSATAPATTASTSSASPMPLPRRRIPGRTDAAAATHRRRAIRGACP